MPRMSEAPRGGDVTVPYQKERRCATGPRSLLSPQHLEPLGVLLFGNLAGGEATSQEILRGLSGASSPVADRPDHQPNRDRDDDDPDDHADAHRPPGGDVVMSIKEHDLYLAGR